MTSGINDRNEANSSVSTGSSATDIQSVALANRLNRDTYLHLLEHVQPQARRVIRRILRSEADVQDALQEACTCAYLKLHTFNGQAKFSTWFIRIAINAALMTLRKKKSSREISFNPLDDDYDFIEDSLIDSHPTPQDLLSSKEERQLLYESIDHLPVNLKSVLRIRLQSDLSIADIAEKLGISIPATKSRIRRATMIVIGHTSKRALHKALSTHHHAKAQCK